MDKMGAMRGVLRLGRGRVVIAAIVGCLAAMGVLLIPAAAGAQKWGQWVQAEDVTETTATVALYIHPLWAETHWHLSVYSERCFNKIEPERCDNNFNTPATEEVEGTVIQKGPYEVVEVDLPIPGPRFESPLQPAKLYEFSIDTTGEGPRLPGSSFAAYETFETPGAPGPEEQANAAKIAKERKKRESQIRASQKGRAAFEKKLAKEKLEHEG
jgi:hypothetical protein